VGPRALWRRQAPTVGHRQWLRQYLFWTLAGAVAAFAISPTSVMFWQGFPVLHVAVLPVVLFVQALLRSGRLAVGRRTAVAVASVVLAVNALVCFASPMFHDLGLHERCGLVVMDQGGWMPDLWRTAPATGTDAGAGKHLR
jgi:hypothetical protein